jgi:hypothetical protein
VLILEPAAAPEEFWKLLNAPNPVAGFKSPPPPPPNGVVAVVGAAGGENEPNILDFCCSLVPVSLSPRLRERPPNDEVSSAMEASLDISGALGGGEVEGGDPALKPKPVCPNTLVLVLVNEPNALVGLANALVVFPNALGVPPNVLPVLDPKPADEPKALEALPNALGAEANAPKPDMVWGGCPKGAGWLNGVLKALDEDVCPNPVVANPALVPLVPVPLPKSDWPKVEEGCAKVEVANGVGWVSGRTMPGYGLAPSTNHPSKVPSFK